MIIWLKNQSKFRYRIFQLREERRCKSDTPGASRPSLRVASRPRDPTRPGWRCSQPPPKNSDRELVQFVQRIPRMGEKLFVSSVVSVLHLSSVAPLFCLPPPLPPFFARTVNVFQSVSRASRWRLPRQASGKASRKALTRQQPRSRGVELTRRPHRGSSTSWNVSSKKLS